MEFVGGPPEAEQPRKKSFTQYGLARKAYIPYIIFSLYPNQFDGNQVIRNSRDIFFIRKEI
ncbi:MAG: hypothetical protein A2W07_06790 [candidate division Zixibacteria bacterium RBG_16_43_9]|nr:MAG: hypothetical protein A2W07_06790 [candidate division Zixibacteria bacterium RBG_16_43_9]